MLRLQFAPSFNTATGVGAANTAAAGETGGVVVGIPGGAASPGHWVLTGKLPGKPAAQLVGPMVRLTAYDPSSAAYSLSVLVVSHPSLAAESLQLHYAVDAPAATLAGAQVLDDVMGYRFWRFDVTITLGESSLVALVAQSTT